MTMAAEMSRTLSLKIEQHLRVCVQPKPRWLPSFAWRWILARLVRIEMTLPTFATIAETTKEDQ